VGWRQNGGNTVDTYLNGVKLSRSLNLGEYRIRTLPDRELEALGYKKHVAGNLSGVNNYNCKMVGIVDIDVTDRQTLRFETSTNTRAEFWLVFIQFIPIDQEQIYPQFDTLGNAVYPLTLMMKIMTKHDILTPVIGLICILLLSVSCSDPWYEHARDNEGLANEPLLERLDKEPESSEFMKLLRSSGVDKVLDGNNAYTVFVPENSRVQA